MQIENKARQMILGSLMLDVSFGWQTFTLVAHLFADTLLYLICDIRNIENHRSLGVGLGSQDRQGRQT